MGNHVSACAFIIMKNSKIKAARVIFPSGEIRQFREVVKAAEVMLECPSFFLVNTKSLNINRRFSPLSADEDLEPLNIYIMFPMRRLNSMVTPADMAVFWMAGGGNNNPNKRITAAASRISPDTTTTPAGDHHQVAVQPRQPRLGVEVPQFSYRLAVCRSRKPFLDTIKEEPIFVR